MLMALALVVAACSSDDADTDTTTTVAGEDNATTTTAGTDSGDTTTTTVDPELPIDAPERTLVVAATGTPSGFDGDIFGPNMQNAVVNLNEPLVDYELAGTEVNGDEVRPRLAESWTVSDDGLTYTIKLREGVLSHLGNELTAEDVVWSYEKSIAQGRTGNFIRNVGNVDSIEATGTYEVQFTLTAPSPIFIRAITVYTPSIYDSTELKTHATDDDPYATEWLKSNFAGYGPYYVDQFTPGQQVIFKANPNYWDGVPYYTTIVYQAVPEPANRVALLTAEEVDYIEAPSQQQLVELSNNSSISVQSVPGNLQARLLANANFEPYDDPLVRQALIYALDTESLVNTAFQGIGVPAKSPVPPSFPCYTDEHWQYTYDVAKAQELLTEAGYPDGIELTLTYSDTRPFDEPLAVQAQAQWAEAGIDVTLEKIPNDEMSARVATGTRDVPFFAFFEQSIVLDPGYLFFLTSLPDGAGNRNDYSNPEVTALVEEANATLDADERCELLSEAQRLHVEDAGWTVSILAGGHFVSAPDVTGWVWFPDNQVRWALLGREG